MHANEKEHINVERHNLNRIEDGTLRDCSWMGGMGWQKSSPFLIYMYIYIYIYISTNKDIGCVLEHNI